MPSENYGWIINKHWATECLLKVTINTRINKRISDFTSIQTITYQYDQYTSHIHILWRELFSVFSLAMMHTLTTICFNLYRSLANYVQNVYKTFDTAFCELSIFQYLGWWKFFNINISQRLKPNSVLHKLAFCLWQKCSNYRFPVTWIEMYTIYQHVFNLFYTTHE